MSWPSLETIAADVAAGKLSAALLTKRSLEAIDQHKDFNAVLRANPQALKVAEAIDAKVKAGKSVGKLAGVPYLAKDNYLSRGLETTAASNILNGFEPPFSATAIELLDGEDAVLVGKTNLDAFAHGSSTENSDFGPTLNPHDKTRVAGGSSGGSAAAVSLELVPLALGSDTGGSIRQPAALCGVVGLKPTYGLVSRYGVVAMASSTDVMGPLTATVADAAYALDVLAQPDWRDSTMIKREKTGYQAKAIDLKGVKLGVVKQFMDEKGQEPAVLEAVKRRIEAARRAGATIVELDIPTAAETALAVYYVLVSAEVSSNLSRYDGLRFGPRAEGKSLDEVYTKTRSQGFNAENKRRILIGTYVLSSGYYDAYYDKAQRVRTLLMQDFDEAFKQVDALISPTSPTAAFKIGDKDADPLSMYMSDVLTVAASLVGAPAISLPCGQDENHLPIGLQLTAQRHNDRRLLEIGLALEGLK